MHGVLKVVYYENMGNGKATNVGTRLKTIGDRGFYCQFIMLSVILKTNTFQTDAGISIFWKTFCFRYFNNSIGVGARIAARYRGAGQMVNDRCTFCLKAGAAVPAREDFIHIFYDCPYIQNTVRLMTDELFPAENDANVRRKMYMCGSVTGVSSIDGLFYKLTSVILNYNMWECKIKKKKNRALLRYAWNFFTCLEMYY